MEATGHSPWLTVFGRLRQDEVRLGLTACGLFLVGTCLYCLSYQAFVFETTPNLARTVTIALREWGIWLLFTPWAFRMFGALETRAAWRQQVIAGLSLAFCAALVPTLIDQVTQTRGVVSSLAIFGPRYLVTVLVIHLLWRVFLKSGRTDSVEQVQPVESTPARPSTLLVSKGAAQCLIHIDDIQHVSAAGNYIEIWTHDQHYLLRSTMAKMQDLLCGERYVRIHRSHLVRADVIERIHTQRSGNGRVHLKSGRTLPLSKSCRQQLLRHKLDMD